jgi:hypothetical protein
MILVQIKSGLGNQMFQYACGRALALRNKDTLKMDISECVRTDMPLWKYRLGVFNVKENFASEEEISLLKFPHGSFSVFLFKVRTKLGISNIGYSWRIKNSKGSLYLNGFFQTERYFNDFSDEIRQEFTLKNPLGDKARMVMDTIQKSPGAVSLHIRRADYASDKTTNTIYGTFTTQYYFDALAYIASKTTEPLHIFFFSDDIEWVKNNVKTPYEATYVSSPDIADHEEIALMSACTHNIISNSTFGWWGAWLNTHKGKIVVAPKLWAKKKKYAYRSIVPTSWIRL